jgi:hypothetical protein
MKLAPDANVARASYLPGGAPPEFVILSGAKNLKKQSEMFRFAQHDRRFENDDFL